MPLMKNNIWLAILIMLLVSVAISNYIFPVYFKGDDADMLACAQYFTKHSISIFNIFSYPGPLYETVNMAMWNYYRPLERVLWTLFFALFGFNPRPLHILEIFLFIWSIYNFLKITNILAGEGKNIAGMLFISIMVIVFPGFLLPLLGFIYHSNTILMLFFISFALLKLLSAFHIDNGKSIFWGLLFSALAFLSKEWSYYAVPSALFLYFCFYWDKASDQQKKQVLKTSALLLFILAPIFLIQEIFRINTPYRFDVRYFISPRFFWLNLAYYKSLLLNNNAWVLVVFGALSLLSYRNKGQVICLAWSVITLLPALFFRNLCDNETLHFFILNIIGLSMFIAISLYLSAKDAMHYAHTNSVDYWLARSYKRSFLLNLIIVSNFIFIPIASSVILTSVLSTPKYLLEYHKYSLAGFIKHKNNFLKVSKAKSDAFFYVPNSRARGFYKTMLYVYGRPDINIEVFNSNNLNGLELGENVLKNSSFELGFDGWKVNYGHLFAFSHNQMFKESAALEVDMNAINMISTNFIDIYQDVRVIPGQTYLFGGWVKVKDFNGRMWFEVRDKRNFQYGNWSAPFLGSSGKDENRWVYVSSLFSPSVENLTFIALRVLSPTRGKVYLSGLFMSPVKGNFLDY